MAQHKPLKVLYGITKSNFGGAQRYVFDLAIQAKEKGYDVAVLCGGEGVLVDKLRSENIKIFSVPSLGRDVSPLDDARSFFYILESLHNFQPDVFHINSSKMGGMGGLAARIMRVPKIIFTAHGWAFNEPRPELQKVIVKFFYWITLLLSHKVICVSEQTKNDVLNWIFIKPKLRVIYNGIEAFPLLSKAEAREILAPGLSQSALLVGTLSELHRVKGLDTLLRAWPVLRKEDKLVLIGEGDERQNLKRLCENLNLEGRVTFKGFMENGRSLLKGIDIFVLPSRSEALSFSILEAGLASLPVIATKVGGIPEIIRSEVNGLLIPPNDPIMLSSALLLLASDKDIRKELGKNLKQTVEEKFSIEEMVRNTFSLY